MKDIIYHHIYIGTGPISVIDAVYKLNESEGEVLLIDEKKQIGGAWVAIEVGDYGELEVGCHIWSFNRKAYRFLEAFLNLDLIALNPQPFFVKGNQRLTYDYKNAALTLKKIVKDGIRLKFKTLTRYIFTNPAARIPIFPKKYLYPRGGAREMQQSLIRALEQCEIHAELGVKILRAIKKDDLWELYSEDGECYRSKVLHLTSTSALQSVEAHNKTIVLEHRKVNYSHVHLVINRKLKEKLSYVRVLDDPYIHRLSDITYQLENALDEEQTVLLVGFFDDKRPPGMSDANFIAHIFDYFKKRNWMDEGTELIYSQINHFETTYIPPEQIKAINALDESIELMHTTDLIYGVYAKLNTWRL